MTATLDIADIPLKTIRGEDGTLGDYAGKVLLIVNVASKCGLTPQYEGLEKLYRDYPRSGPRRARFPANDFAGQEPRATRTSRPSARPISASTPRCSRRSR